MSEQKREERLRELEEAYDRKLKEIGRFADPKFRALGELMPDLVQAAIDAQSFFEGWQTALELANDYRDALRDALAIIAKLQHENEAMAGRIKAALPPRDTIE